MWKIVLRHFVKLAISACTKSYLSKSWLVFLFKHWLQREVGHYVSEQARLPHLCWRSYIYLPHTHRGLRIKLKLSITEIIWLISVSIECLFRMHDYLGLTPERIIFHLSPTYESIESNFVFLVGAMSLLVTDNHGPPQIARPCSS